MQQIVMTAPVSTKKQDYQVPEGKQSQEIRDGTPEWKSVVKVVLIVALIAAIAWASKIIIPKVVALAHQATSTAGATVDATTTVLNAVETSVTNVAEGISTAVNSVGDAVASMGDSTALVVNSVAINYEKVATSVANTIDFVGDALTKPLPVVLIEQFVEHGPQIIDHVISPTEPWKTVNFLKFVHIL